MNCLVLDFGGSSVKYSVMNEKAEQFASGEDAAPLASAEQFVECVDRLYRQYRTQIDGVAISIPGLIDAESGYAKTAGAYLPLFGKNIVDLLREKINVPISVENDGKCGALAEVWRGNLQDCNDGAVFIIGTGIAGGIVKNRRIHKGKTLNAGEFSFLLLGDEEDLRSTAFYKCGMSTLLFESCLAKGIDVKRMPYYSLLGQMFPVVDQELSEWDNEPAYRNGIDGFQFFELLEKGDEDISRLYEKFVTSICHMLLNVQIIYAPDRILIGGGVSRNPRLIRDIQKKYDTMQALYQGLMNFSVRIDSCKFLSEANQYGAFYNFLLHYRPEIIAGA